MIYIQLISPEYDKASPFFLCLTKFRWFEWFLQDVEKKISFLGSQRAGDTAVPGVESLAQDVDTVKYDIGELKAHNSAPVMVRGGAPLKKSAPVQFYGKIGGQRLE